MSEFAHIVWRGRPVRLEYQWVGAAAAPLIIFLHEGLGSVSMWRDFPQRLCAALGARGLVYSRPGYGRSTPRPADETWGPDFLHQQAHEVLPALLAALHLDAGNERPVLFGHSDGGSIALLYAACFSERLRGIVTLAPHICVEDLSVASIQQAKTAYEQGDLRERLARHHEDPDSAFWGWNRIWLDSDFRSWRIDGELSGISCPVLALQGLDDEYGTLAQIRGIGDRVSHAVLEEIPSCGHSPHRDQPEAVIATVRKWFETGGPPPDNQPVCTPPPPFH